jgi:hypothetical protein
MAETEVERICLFAIDTVLRETRTFDGSHHSYIAHLADAATREKIRTLFFAISPAHKTKCFGSFRIANQTGWQARHGLSVPNGVGSRGFSYVLLHSHFHYALVTSLDSSPPPPQKWVDAVALLGYGERRCAVSPSSRPSA